jgi:N-acetylmuramoyl-L-alanine amidase
MRAADIPAREQAFRNTGVDSGGKRHILSPFQITVPGSTETVSMVECARDNGDKSFFYDEQFPKERIVLHYTAGFLPGDIDTLTTHNNHVSVPFVVARDGTIYNLWTSSRWSYHLGSGASGGNEMMSKKSVAIEISNIGWLAKNGNDFYDYTNHVYCTSGETQYYTQVPTYRDHRYYAAFTGAQYQSIIKLVRFLTKKYTIPRVFLPQSERYNRMTDAAAAQFRGITTHVNYRTTKWDIGPAFDWNRIITGVQAP